MSHDPGEAAAMEARANLGDLGRSKPFEVSIIPGIILSAGLSAWLRGDEPSHGKSIHFL